MKITSELLERYYTGSCTEKEKQAIEAWLDSPEAETAFPSKDRLATIEKEIWSNIDPEKQSKIIPFNKKLTRFAAAACLAIGLFGAGHFICGEVSIQENSLASLKDIGFLHVTSSKGKTVKLAGDKFNVKVDGLLKFYNSSSSVKEITCGEKTFTLEPMRYYYISDSSKGAFAIQEDRSSFELFEPRLEGDFCVLLKS